MNNVICLCLSPSLARGPSGHPCELESWIWSPGYKPEVNRHRHSLKVILGKRSVSGSLNTRTWDLAAGTLSNGAAWPGVVRYDVLAMTLVGPVCRSVPLIFHASVGLVGGNPPSPKPRCREFWGRQLRDGHTVESLRSVAVPSIIGPDFQLMTPRMRRSVQPGWRAAMAFAAAAALSR